MKKILEIEGLLDKYGHLVNDDETDRRQGYPRNNYSGLNSLRARLKNRHWDGISPLDSASIGYGNNGDDAEKPGIIVSERTELIQAGNCIGSPVYFFFNLNTAHLTDASQMLNLDELARVAKKYGLSLRVTGAADSSTGTPVLNGSLSTSRADYIVAELKKAWHTDRTHRQGKQRRHSRPCTGRSQQAYESRVVLLVFTFTFIESLNL